MEMVALTLMPISWAAPLSSEQARMALPSLVLLIKVVRAAMMIRQATTGYQGHIGDGQAATEQGAGTR